MILTNPCPAYDNNPASGANKTSLGLVTTILEVNLNNTNPLNFKAKKILPAVAQTVSFFQNHDDFFAEYYSQLGIHRPDPGPAGQTRSKAVRGSLFPAVQTANQSKWRHPARVNCNERKGGAYGLAFRKSVGPF